MSNSVSYVFFGTSEFSVIILDELKNSGFLPKLIVTQEDKPQGRHLVLTPPPVKVWAEQNAIPYLQPKTLKDPLFFEAISNESYDLFIVASYGKIIPQVILDIPKFQTLNVHPSLLPKLRGPSPIQTSILTEQETGVTIMRLDSKMDEGPIVAQKKVAVPEWPPYEQELETLLGHTGGKLLAETIPGWIDGSITEITQDNSLATYCKKITKEDAQINLANSPEKNLRIIRAFSTWPRARTTIVYDGKEFPLIILSAHIENGELILDRVLPPGKKEMNFEEFKHGFLHQKKS